MFKIIEFYILRRKINKAQKTVLNIIYSEAFIVDTSNESKPVLDKFVSRTNWEKRLILNHMLRAIAKNVMESRQSLFKIEKDHIIEELNSMRSKRKRYGTSDFNELLPLYFDKEEALTSIEFMIAKLYLRRMQKISINNPYSYDGLCFRKQMAKRQSLSASEKAQIKGQAAEIEALETHINESERDNHR